MIRPLVVRLGPMSERASLDSGWRESATVAKRRAHDDFPRNPAPGLARGKSKSVGDVFRDCPSCPEMVVLPNGFFLMGDSPDSEVLGHEQPYHPVTIAQPLAVGRYEVTFDEWDTCVAEGGCNGHRCPETKSGAGGPVR